MTFSAIKRQKSDLGSEKNMSGKMTIEDFESDLGALQGLISYYAENNELDMLFDFAYPDHQKQLAELEAALQEIAMYEPVKAALAQSEVLARQGKYEEAEDVILEVNRALMRASGTWAKMEKRYPPKNAS